MKRNLRLLFVDDDADDRQLFMEAVSEVSKTMVCETAKDGQQAFEYLEDPARSLPDLIFLDLRMPKINGKVCLTRIKKDERLRQIPVIIYTTSRDISEANELKALGAAHFTSKPTNPDEIYYLISFILEELRAQE